MKKSFRPAGSALALVLALITPAFAATTTGTDSTPVSSTSNQAVGGQNPAKTAKKSAPTPARTAEAKTAAAQSKQDAITLPPIVITVATRDPQAPDTTAATTTVVTQEELQANQYTTVSDALTKVPGLAVVSSGAPDQPTSIFIHGMPANATLFTIDGRRQPVDITGAYNFANLTLDNVDQIEVVRTPSSSMQGGNSAGGIINLVSLTGRGLAQPVSSASFEGGSYDYYRGNIQSRGAVKDFDYAVSVTELTEGANRFNENVRNTTYRGNFGYQITPTIYVDLHTGYSDSNVGAPNEIVAPNPVERVQTSDWFISPEVVAQVTDFYTTKFYYNHDVQVLTDSNPYTDFLLNYAFLYRVPVNTDSIDWQNNFQLATHWSLTAGVQADDSRVDLTNQDLAFGTGTTTITNTLTTIGGYIESQWAPIDGLNVLTSIRDDQYSDYNGAFSWRQGVAYTVPQTKTQVHASGSSAYTPPSIADLYYPLSGNPNLKPETTLGWEVGVAQPFLDGKVTPGVTYFHNHIKNYIESSGAPAYTTFNTGPVVTDGVEVNIAAKPIDQLTINLNYTYLNADDESPVATYPRVPRVPRNSFNFTATYQPIDPLTITLGGSWTMASQDNNYDPFTFTSTRVTLPDYFVLRASATYKINKYVSIWTRGENLTDKQYQPVYGYPALGAAVYGGLKISF